MSMPSAILVYITTPDLETARTIAHAVVEDRLAACANILPGMLSVYRWQGRVEEAEELVLILKTSSDLFDSVAARVKGLHPYDCPCIVALPVTQCAPEFSDWINESVCKPI